MKLYNNKRRNFLRSLSAGTAGTLLINSIFPLSAMAQSDLSSEPESNTDFLFADGLIYLNTGTLGPCRKEVVQETTKLWESLESHPLKFYGRWGTEPLAEKTRNTAAGFLGCHVDELVLTTGTTNGMNAIAQGLRLKAGDRMITTDQEHGGGLFCWTWFAKYYGVVIDTVQINSTVDTAESILAKINKAIKKETKLISVSHVLSSTGLRMPVQEISALARSKGILSVVDGAQSVGAINVNVKDIGCHAYATSGHKWLMGPKATGILYLSNDVHDRIKPMQFEESYHTYNPSNGVVNLASILGLGTAIEYIESIGINKIEEHNLSLRNHLYEKLAVIKNLSVMSPPKGPLAAPMIGCRIPEKLDRLQFSTRILEKYKVSIRPTSRQWFNGVRLSTHMFNTISEIDFAAEAIQKELNSSA